ncbi:MAG: hypothetical protein LBB61_06540 [Treponema sp.]|nr:hypothetical protein [Treponema sp.]
MMKITGRKIIKAVIPYGFIVLYKYLKQIRGEPLRVKGDPLRIKEEPHKNLNNEFPWLMTENERTLFKKYISGSKVYLEFGSGGSTIVTLGQTSGKVYSVESSKEWINHMYAKYEIIRKSSDTGRLNLFHADIGPTGPAGAPVVSGGEKEKDVFIKYSQEIFEKHPEVKSSDVVLVDGRFRVASCLYSLLNVREDTVIMFHDFWNRPYYHGVMKYVHIIDGVDSLMICKRRTDNSADEIKKEYNEYKYVFE